MRDGCCRRLKFGVARSKAERGVGGGVAVCLVGGGAMGRTEGEATGVPGALRAPGAKLIVGCCTTDELMDTLLPGGLPPTPILEFAWVVVSVLLPRYPGARLASTTIPP